MKIKQAQEYFELGVITSLDAVRDPLNPGNWILSINGKEDRSWTLETALGDTKSFAKLDTLVGQVEIITGRVSSLHIGV